MNVGGEDFTGFTCFKRAEGHIDDTKSWERQIEAIGSKFFLGEDEVMFIQVGDRAFVLTGQDFISLADLPFDISDKLHDSGLGFCLELENP